jgi:FixJ family two-component response regulator
VTRPPLVLIVDDDDDLRRALELLIRSAGYDVASFGSAEDFLRRPLPDRPACLLLDLRLPDIDGLALHETLQARNNPLPIVFLTGHGDVRTSVRAIRAGAIDFLEKPVEADQLLASIARAIVFDQERRHARDAQETVTARFARLSRRELEVCRLVAAGLPNKTIASQLGISLRTVKVHRGRVMQKLEAGSLAEVVRLVTLLPKG